MRPCSPASILCRHFASLHLLPGVGRVELDSRFRRVEEGHEPRPHYVDKSKRDAQDPEGRRHDGGGGGLVRVVCTVSSVWCGVGGTILRRVDLSEILWTVSAASCTADRWGGGGSWRRASYARKLLMMSELYIAGKKWLRMTSGGGGVVKTLDRVANKLLYTLHYEQR